MEYGENENAVGSAIGTFGQWALHAPVVVFGKEQIMVTPWTLAHVQDFRVWHENKLNDLYPGFNKLQAELRQARERWLVMVLPREIEMQKVK